MVNTNEQKNNLEEAKKRNIILLMGFSLAFIALYFIEPFKTFPPTLILFSKTLLLFSILLLILKLFLLEFKSIKRSWIHILSLSAMFVGILLLFIYTLHPFFPFIEDNSYFLQQKIMSKEEAEGRALCVLSGLGVKLTDIYKINSATQSPDNKTWNIIFNVSNETYNINVENKKFMGNINISSADIIINATKIYFEKCLPGIPSG